MAVKAIPIASGADFIGEPSTSAGWQAPAHKPTASDTRESMGFPPEIGPRLKKALTKKIPRMSLKPKWVGLIAIPLAFGIGAMGWKCGVWAQALVAMLLWFWLSHKNPSLSPVRKIKAETIDAGGFRFFSLDGKLRKLPLFLEKARDVLGKARDESGLLWEGLGLGVCRPNSHHSLNEGKAYMIGVRLYGTNEGVGHYSYRAYDGATGIFVGDGHFNLLPFEVGSDTWMREVQNHIGKALVRDLNDLIRPIDVAYDPKKTDLSFLRMYDPVSGRELTFNENRRSGIDDFFVFGPYPSKIPSAPATAPGITLKPIEEPGDPSKRFHIQPIVDIHGRMVSYGNVTIKCAEGSGYSYNQQLNGFTRPNREVVITIPSDINKAHIQIKRGGFHSVESTVSIDGPNEVFVRMEPIR